MVTTLPTVDMAKLKTVARMMPVDHPLRTVLLDAPDALEWDDFVVSSRSWSVLMMWYDGYRR